ncbi:MAG: alpha-L-fucosidase [Lentisphaeria bacterium]|nr:alpha-L-fucosidase [Lentisphaeria bacterium]
MENFGKGDSSWFTHDRFGMFIHWGLYALPARHEWVKRKEEIPDADYQKYFERFDPDLFDPSQWAAAAKNAGMKYVVFTTKHHEGFCMFDSQFTDYKSTNTPCGRDLLREVVDAFRAEGLRIGLYHSLIDWHHPDFIIDSNHPMLNHPDREAMNQPRDMSRYRTYLHNQTRELLTNYGDIDIIWFDFSYPQAAWNPKGHDDWDSAGLVRMIRSIRPSILINNRLDLPGAGDITTPEQNTPEDPILDENGNLAVWEGCQTFSGSWGYNRDEMTWKSEKQCIDMLINHVARGGNLLMNVGPTSRGYLDHRALERLEGFGRWMKYCSRSIYGCGIAPTEFPEPRDSRYTYDPVNRRLYLHLMNWPFRYINLKHLAGKVAYAQLLHDGSEIQFKEPARNLPHNHLAVRSDSDTLTLILPVVKPEITVPVVELFLK